MIVLGLSRLVELILVVFVFLKAKIFFHEDDGALVDPLVGMALQFL